MTRLEKAVKKMEGAPKDFEDRALAALVDIIEEYEAWKEAGKPEGMDLTEFQLDWMNREFEERNRREAAKVRKLLS